MSQTKEKHDSLVLSRSDLWVVWRSHGITCLLFLFRTNSNKGHLDQNNFHHCYGYFFESGFLKATWSQLHSKSPLSSHKAHWQQHFERYPTILYFMDMDQHAYYIFHQDCGKRDWKENRWKCLEKGKFHKNPSVHLEEHCTKGKSLFHLFYALLFLWNLVFKFNIVLIGLGG